MYFVYILRTLDNSLYVGVTENVDERIATHNSGKGAEWTRAHCGARLVYSEPHITLSSARKRELQAQEMVASQKGSTDCVKFRAVEGFESVQINF
jgi:putative endonuclease